MRRPSLRGRLALLAALAVFVAVTVAGGTGFAITIRVLSDQVDTSLRDGIGSAPLRAAPTGQPGGQPAGQQFTPQELCNRLRTESSNRTQSLTVLTVLAPDGTTCEAPGREQIVVLPRDRAVAASGTGGGLRDGVSATGDRLRVMVRPAGQGYAVLAGRSLAELDALTSRLRGLLFALSLVAALLALGLGFAVARAGLRPVDRLTDAAEEVARTKDLALRIDIPPRRRDEVTRLATAFNAMIAALSVARDRQAQLVADAGHELRTPLTSLRTNIDLLVRSERLGRPLPEAQRQALLASLTAQLEELTHLVGELVVLAKEEPVGTPVPVRLDGVLDTAVDRARRRAGDRVVDVPQNDPWVVHGDPATLERAVVNLLDNAVKFSPAGSAVTVRQVRGTVTIDDQGPGVPAHERDAAFDRFWRGDAARALPGSGLGLAIVADAAAAHGGSARLERAAGGGTRAVLILAGRPADEKE